jgi:L-amino acid N-acyltransferase YncA
MPITIRSAELADIDQVRSIFEYYVVNTVLSFVIQKPPEEYVRSRYEASKQRQLPYLVAVDSEAGKVVGYAYASSFRGFMLGYGHTVEMTIFCHPDRRGQGTGNLLMKAILGELRQTKHLSHEVGYEENVVEFDVKNVLAIMAIDESGPKGGLALRDWYLRYGFEEVGRLKGVGWKLGRV